MRRIKYFFVLLASFAVISCIGEDVEGGAIDLSIINDGLFSLGINEDNSGILNLESTLDNDTNFKVFWESNDPDVIDIDENGRLLPATDVNQIGKEVTISATAFSVNNEGNIEGDPILILQPRKIRLGKITIKNIDVAGLAADELDDLAKYGFSEELQKTQSLSSIGVTDNTQKLGVSFLNFKREIEQNPMVTWSSSNSSILEVDAEGALNPITKAVEVVNITATLPAELTSRGVALQQVFEIVVGDETQIIDPVNDNEKVLIGSGVFQANNGYNSRGDFKIYRDSEGIITLEVADNFVAPIPVRELYASNTTGDDISTAVLISDSYARSGAQTFVIDFDITNFNFIYIYCASIRRNAGFGVIN